jgi:hypothetical protein
MSSPVVNGRSFILVAGRPGARHVAGSVLLFFAAACAGVKQVPELGNGAAGQGSAGAGGPAAGGASGVGSGAGGGPATSGAAGTIGPAGGCKNLQCQQTGCTQGACQQHACPGTTKTTLSGTIYDPAGKTPLYNVIVYVPNATPSAITEGVSCDKCAGTATGSPISPTLTDANGQFVMDDPPVGSNIPLVIQIGKWRREVTVPSITACQDNPLSDVNLTRLPANQNEGHIPSIALTTGHADALECLLRKIGLADSEFTTDAGTGRVHMYYGGDLTGPTGSGAGANSFDAAHGGAAFSSASTLWGSLPKLMSYDIVILSCEGSQYQSAKQPYFGNMKMYGDAGGRIFMDHLHFDWLKYGPAPWPQTANYIGVGKDLPSPFTANIDTSFPKGVAFAQWLVNVGATTAPPAGSPETIQILQGQYSVEATVPPYTQRWIYTDHNPNDSKMNPGVEYMTMNTPAELAATMPANQCGRIVFTDVHVVSASTSGAQDTSRPTTPFPGGCVTSGALSPQEKALEFMLFDLSSCVQPDPIPPTITVN